MKKNILVGQSGGPTAVINASLYGVIQEGLSHPDEIGAVYGMINGIEGFLSGHTINLSAELSKEGFGTSAPDARRISGLLPL